MHPSLRAAVKGKQQKSVLKRAERIKHMMTRGLWKDDSKVFGMPKIKALRIKIKKEKVEKTAEAGAAPAGAAASAAPLPAEKSKAASKK